MARQLLKRRPPALEQLREAQRAALATAPTGGEAGCTPALSPRAATLVVDLRKSKPGSRKRRALLAALAALAPADLPRDVLAELELHALPSRDAGAAAACGAVSPAEESPGEKSPREESAGEESPVEEFAAEDYSRASARAGELRRADSESRPSAADFAAIRSQDAAAHLEWLQARPESAPADGANAELRPRERELADGCCVVGGTGSEALADARAALPVADCEVQFIENLRAHYVNVVVGGTGTGKSTQIPQFVLAAGFARTGATPLAVCVTQPRRAAVKAVYSRIAEELGSSAQHVAYHIRDDFCRARGAELLRVVTEAMLLNYIKQDFLLRRFSVVVLDEVHERSHYCDMLLFLLSVICRARHAASCADARVAPLRLVLMSATLCVNGENFFELDELFAGFARAQLRVSGVTHRVTEHFEPREPASILDAAAALVLKINAKLPSGSVLVFLPGKREIGAVQALLEAVQSEDAPQRDELQLEADSDDADALSAEALSAEALSASGAPSPALRGASGADAGGGADAEDLRMARLLRAVQRRAPEVDEAYAGAGFGRGRLRVFQLYSGVDSVALRALYALPAADERFVILATNVAETSITVPNVRYVVDSCLVKQKTFASCDSVASVSLANVSRANAIQRAGRCGRVGPGHCYRLCSRETFAQFANFSEPEIQKVPCDALVLFLAALGARSVASFIAQFKLPAAAVASGVAALQWLGLLAPGCELRITPKGRMVVDLSHDATAAAALLRLLHCCVHHSDGRAFGWLSFQFLLLCEQPRLRDAAQLAPSPADRDDLDYCLRAYSALTADARPRDEGWLSGLAAQWRALLANCERVLRAHSAHFNCEPAALAAFAASLAPEQAAAGAWPRGSATQELVQALRTCVCVDYAPQIALRYTQVRSMTQADVQSLPRSEYAKFKRGYLCERMRGPLLIDSASALYKRRPQPAQLCFLKLRRQAERQTMQCVLSVPSLEQVRAVLDAERKRVPLLAQLEGAVARS